MELNKLMYVTLSCMIAFVITATVYPFITEWDNHILITISQWRTENLTDFMIWISRIGSFSIHIWIIGIICFLFIVRKRYSVAVIIIFNILLSMLLNHTLKEFFQRLRPDIRMMEVGGYSFPSGHTMNNVAIYGFFIFLVLISSMNRGLKCLLVTFMVLLTGTIAFSRMYLAVHYPTDIIGGICGGLFVVTISIYLYIKTQK